MRISDSHKVDAQTVELRLEDGPTLRLPLEVCLRFKLDVGQALNPALMAEVEFAAEVWQAKRTALSLLEVRDRSRVELLRRARSEHVSDEAAEQAMKDLERAGLVDDARFAASWVREHTKGQRHGRDRLLRDLERQGVDEDVALAAIEGALTGDSSEIALAREALGKWRPKAGEPPQKAAARMAAFLARRGFPQDVVLAVVQEQIGELGLD